MGTETTAIVRSEVDEVAERIDSIVKTYSADSLRHLSPTTQGLQRARGMFLLQEAFTEGVVKRFMMPLMGSRLGFVTDLDRGTTADPNKRYDWITVRTFGIEAMLGGFYLINNEVNLIAGNCYVAQAGMIRKVEESVEDLDVQFGVPALVGDKGALVQCIARWRRNGKPEELILDVIPQPDGRDKLDRRIVVRVNSGMGADAIIGKAKRKAHAAIYEKIRRVSIPTVGDTIDTEGEEVREPSAAASTIDEMAAEHARKKSAAANGARPSEPPPAKNP